MSEKEIGYIVMNGTGGKSTYKLAVLLIYLMNEKKKIRNLKIKWIVLNDVLLPEVEIKFL